MIKQEFSPTRSRTGWKPRVDESDVPLFRCPACGHVLAGVTDGGMATSEGVGRATTVGFPTAGIELPECGRCGARMEAIPLVAVDDVPEELQLDFQFRGGFNANCVKVKWSAKRGSGYALEWVMVKTFTGTQLKYVTPGKFSPLTFAFADEDAYCYCDSDPCEECMFRCKFGMVAYCFVTNLGLVRMPFDRMLASGAGAGNAGMRRPRA
jgi:hypothetical protein